MRLRHLFACAAVALIAAPSASAAGSNTSSGEAGGLPDLPGMSAVERVTAVPAAPDQVEPADDDRAEVTTHQVVSDERPSRRPEDAAGPSGVDAASLQAVTDLPGGGSLPLPGNLNASPAAAGTLDSVLLAIALVVVVLFTRFLVRLNSVR